MALLTVQHPVQDYQAWREVYDSLGDMQRAAGVTGESVHQLADAPNTVLVLHTFATAAEAEDFLANPELLAAMERAGVAGPPRIEIYG